MDKRTLIFILCIGAVFFGLNYYFENQKEQERLEWSKKKESLAKTKEAAPTPIPAKEEEVKEKSKELLFVLENTYQQLVFSNYGAALKEINLPFKNDKTPNSLVREIEFDRTMQSDYPYNDHFPSSSYYTPSKESTSERTLNTKTQIGGYYPLIRRDLVLSPNQNKITVPPRYYAFNIVSDYPELAELVYEVKEFDENHIVFEAIQQHRRITKTFSLAKNPDNPSQHVPYFIDLSIKIEGDSKGLWLTTGVPEVELISGSFSPVLKYRITRQNKADVETMDLPKEKETISVSSVYPNWVSNSNGYLGIILGPVNETVGGYKIQYVPGKLAPTKLVDIDAKYERFKINEFPGYNTLLPLKGNEETINMRIFAGPYAESALHAADLAFFDPETGYEPDYTASQSFQGWFSFISEPFAKFLLILMNFFYMLTSSWAASIVLLTIALRIMLYPLNAWSFKSMRRMQELAPEVAAIQAKHKKDQKKAQMEIMNLYRSKHVNPFTGCLPILIQMPFLIGMFDLLKSTFALRGVPFIPGWIDNLTAPDVLFSWSYPIPFVGTEFHLLPFLLGAVMYFQQKMSSTAPKDPALLTDQQRQQKFMSNIMVIFFTVMFYNFPSGLNIYWLSSMLLGILQQWYTNKQLSRPKRPTVEVMKG
ncbi:MAG: membrane protein insertase YidC [Chlamydiales bacterium]|nr:membrane protein insertase YidC [Chlamydiales bacterium]